MIPLLQTIYFINTPTQGTQGTHASKVFLNINMHCIFSLTGRSLPLRKSFNYLFIVCLLSSDKLPQALRSVDEAVRIFCRHCLNVETVFGLLIQMKMGTGNKKRNIYYKTVKAPRRLNFYIAHSYITDLWNTASEMLRVKGNVEKTVLWKAGKEKTIWLTLSEEFN